MPRYKFRIMLIHFCPRSPTYSLDWCCWIDRAIPLTRAKATSALFSLWKAFCEGMRQKSLEAAAYLAVALAGCSFEASPVCHGDASSALLNQPFLVERSHDSAGGGALHPNDPSQELMGER